MTIRHFFSDESGQTVIVAALALVVVIGAIGLAVDVGRLRYVKHNIQKAADAAAIAAGLEIRVCGSNITCTAMQTAAKRAIAENGYTVDNFLINCAAAPSTGLSLTLNRPACALGNSDPNRNKNSYVEVVVSSVEHTYFARLLGWDNVRITARAEATRSSGPCIYALDPSSAGAISILAGIAVNANCAIIDESTSPYALSCVVGAFLTAPKVNVAGGVGSLLCGLSTTPRTNIPPPTPADPLAYLPKPTVGECGTTTSSPYTGAPKAVNILLFGNYTFNPGVYCGGISITAAVATNITFNPGVYILKTGKNALGIESGGFVLTASLLSNITATGVTFYNAGPFGSLSVTAPAAVGLSNVKISAPTSGTYSGILFFQDPADTSSGTFVANLLQGSKLEGAIYLPTASVSYGVSAISSSYNILVAKDINFNVALASNFGTDYSSLDTGSPIGGDDAVLAQ